MGFLLQSAVIAMVVCSVRVSADVTVNYDRNVFGQAMTQVLNEEFSALNAMNAKLNDLANRCQQKMDSASKSCTDCIRNSGCQVASCRSCRPYCENFVDSNGKFLSPDETTTKVCGYKYLDQMNEGKARSERLLKDMTWLHKSGAQVLQQLWTNGNRVSKLVILEENGSSKTIHVQTTITYDAANPKPAFLAIVRLILNQEY